MDEYLLSPVQVERIRASEGLPVTKEVQINDWGVVYSISTGRCDDLGEGRTIWDLESPCESVEAEIMQDSVVKAILKYLEER